MFTLIWRWRYRYATVCYGFCCKIQQPRILRTVVRRGIMQSPAINYVIAFALQLGSSDEPRPRCLNIVLTVQTPWPFWFSDLRAFLSPKSIGWVMSSPGPDRKIAAQRIVWSQVTDLKTNLPRLPTPWILNVVNSSWTLVFRWRLAALNYLSKKASAGVRTFAEFLSCSLSASLSQKEFNTMSCQVKRQ